MFRIHARSSRVVMLLGVLIGTAALTTASPKTFRFISINAGHGEDTIPSGINDRRQIVGYYAFFAGADQRRHGFSLIDSVFRTIDVPGALHTWARGINNQGTIVGSYQDVVTGRLSGFRLDGEVFTPIDVGGAVATEVMGINDRGDVVGVYNASRGFMMRGAVITLIDYPDAAFTIATGINNHGDVVGYYYVEGWHGFHWRDGAFSTFDEPEETNSFFLHGINDAGRIVGGYDNRYGFILKKEQLTDVAIPGALRTTPQGINNRGLIVGTFESPTLPGVVSGFLADFD